MLEQSFLLSLIGYIAVLLAAMQAQSILGGPQESESSKRPLISLCYLLFFAGCVLTVLSIGTRSIEIGTDTYVYADEFKAAFHGQSVPGDHEPLFVTLVKALSVTSSPVFLFTVIAAIFVVGFIVASRRMYSGLEVVILFYIWLSTPFFWALSTNVLRQGVALGFVLASFFALCQDRRGLFLALGIIACGFHSSSIALLGVAFLCRNVDIKYLFAFWVVSMLLPLFTVPTQLFEAIVPVASKIGLGRYFEQYLYSDPGEYEVGFKLRFVVFSVAPVLAYLYWKRSNLVDESTEWLVKTYVAMNSLACLSFHIPFNDRAFLLSWSLLPFVLYAAIPTEGMKREIAIIAIAVPGFWFLYSNWFVPQA